MAAPRKYPPELRERAIRLAVDARRDPVAGWSAFVRIGEQLGINPDTLRGWVLQAEIDEGRRPFSRSRSKGSRERHGTTTTRTGQRNAHSFTCERYPVVRRHVLSNVGDADYPNRWPGADPGDSAAPAVQRRRSDWRRTRWPVGWPRRRGSWRGS